MKVLDKILLKFLDAGGCLVGSYPLHLITNCGYNDIDIFFSNAGDLYRGEQIETDLPVDLRLSPHGILYDEFDMTVTQVAISRNGVNISLGFEKTMKTGIVDILWDNIIAPKKTIARVHKYESRGFIFDGKDKIRLEHMR